MTDRRALQAMITGFRLSAALNVAADLGISDLLVGGPRTVADLAEATSAPTRTPSTGCCGRWPRSACTTSGRTARSP